MTGNEDSGHGIAARGNVFPVDGSGERELIDFPEDWRVMPVFTETGRRGGIRPLSEIDATREPIWAEVHAELTAQRAEADSQQFTVQLPPAARLSGTATDATSGATAAASTGSSTNRR